MQESSFIVTASEDQAEADNRAEYMPVEVVILTEDYEIRGLVHVSRHTKEDRRLGDLLNDPQRRFLAVTDAELFSRRSPSSPRMYSFLQLRIDTVNMIHPSTQAAIGNASTYNQEHSAQFDRLRDKVNQKL